MPPCWITSVWPIATIARHRRERQHPEDRAVADALRLEDPAHEEAGRGRHEDRDPRLATKRESVTAWPRRALREQLSPHSLTALPNLTITVPTRYATATLPVATSTHARRPEPSVGRRRIAAADEPSADARTATYSRSSSILGGRRRALRIARETQRRADQPQRLVADLDTRTERLRLLLVERLPYGAGSDRCGTSNAFKRSVSSADVQSANQPAEHRLQLGVVVLPRRRCAPTSARRRSRRGPARGTAAATARRCRSRGRSRRRQSEDAVRCGVGMPVAASLRRDALEEVARGEVRHRGELDAEQRGLHAHAGPGRVALAKGREHADGAR